MTTVQYDAAPRVLTTRANIKKKPLVAKIRTISLSLSLSLSLYQFLHIDQPVLFDIVQLLNSASTHSTYRFHGLVVMRGVIV